MGYLSKFLSISAALMLLSVSVVGAEEKDPLKPRVPADQMAEAKGLKNKFEADADSIAKGGKILNPSPRDFTNCKFHKKRKDGELFWVIKNGSPGTGMVSLIPAAITEDEAWHIINYERSFCKKD